MIKTFHPAAAAAAAAAVGAAAKTDAMINIGLLTRDLRPVYNIWRLCGFASFGAVR